MDRRSVLRGAGYSLVTAFMSKAMALDERSEENNLQDKDNANNSFLINESRSFSGELVSDLIIVSSRDELLEAQNFIKNSIKKRTEILLNKNFEPWIAGRTDIDLAFVTLVGHADGTVIDASGIPNIEGNYFIRFYNSGALDHNRLPNLGGSRMTGILVQGPGRKSKVIGRLFHSPEGLLGNIVMGAVTLTEFGRGDVYQSNSYNISHYGVQIFRSGVHIDMPYGYINYGENISYFGGVIATSQGIGVRNSNPDGEFYLAGVSVDYVGRVLEANAGSIVIHGGHHEFNNKSNPIKLIPYYCGKEQSASIVIRDTTIMGFNRGNLPVSAVVESAENGGGVYLYSCRLLNLLTQQNTFKTGEGLFSAVDTRLLNGNGNFAVSLLLSQSENQLADGDFSSSQSGDWFVYFDKTKNTKGSSNGSIAIENTYKIKKNIKNKEMQFTKLTGSGAQMSLVAMVPARRMQNYTYSFNIIGDEVSDGKILVSAYFVSVSYFREDGSANLKNKLRHGPVREIEIGSIRGCWRRVFQSPLRLPAPDWATHYMLVINADSMSQGSLTLANALITSI
ncbi:hypothetical protein [Serratia nematodiphila]|uniref:hypothetical protein n=1 Tax=Serratia nematodiphila TaxID=458197 RepID=UPI0011D8DE1E|nr:hypothetical protein [Serratia nematodiphila]TXE64168.1 hypothetical protein FOT58_07320 [Serratia nematodiphila]